MRKLDEITNEELIKYYGDIIRELKARKIIRTKKVVGDLGEHLAINFYCETPELPNLNLLSSNEQYIDAISDQGKSYSIKTTTSKTTGVFYGIDKNLGESQKFDFVLVVQLDDNYALKRIIEVPWDKFIRYKKWHSTMKAYNLSITNRMVKDCNIVYQ